MEMQSLHFPVSAHSKSLYLIMGVHCSQSFHALNLKWKNSLFCWGGGWVKDNGRGMAKVALTTFILHHSHGNIQLLDRFVTFIEPDLKLLKTYTVSPWSHGIKSVSMELGWNSVFIPLLLNYFPVKNGSTLMTQSRQKQPQQKEVQDVIS